MAVFSFLDHFNLIEDDSSRYEVGISDQGFSYLDLVSDKKARKISFAEKQERETGAALDGTKRARGRSNIQQIEELDHDEICFDTDLISILKDIEERRSRASVFPAVLTINFVIILAWLFFLWQSDIPFLALGLSSIFVIPTSVFSLVNAWYLDRSRKDIHFAYKISGKGEVAFNRINSALNDINDSGQTLVYSGRKFFEDSRYTGGAEALPDFEELNCRRGLPPLLDLPFDVWHIRAFNKDLFFMPDHLLVFDGANMGGVNYANLEIETCKEETQARGIAKPTHDAKVVGKTYRFVNKDGSPDQRFNNNTEIAIIEYGLLKFRGSGLDLTIYITDQNAASTAPLGFSTITELAKKPVLKVASERRKLAEERKKEQQELLFSIVLDAMNCVMFADGDASKAEQLKIKQLMQKIKSPWDDEQLKSKMRLFRDRLRSQGLSAVVDDVSDQITSIENAKQIDALRKCLTLVMSADGEIHPESKRVKSKLASALNSQ